MNIVVTGTIFDEPVKEKVGDGEVRAFSLGRKANSAVAVVGVNPDGKARFLAVGRDAMVHEGGLSVSSGTQYAENTVYRSGDIEPAGVRIESRADLNNFVNARPEAR